MDNRKIIVFYGSVYRAFIGKTTGGAELQISYLAKGLAKNNYIVHIIETSEILLNHTLEGVNFIFLKNKEQNNTLIETIEKIQPDFIYGRIRTFRHFLPFLISRKCSIKFILGLAHDLDVSNFKNRLKYFYRDKSLYYFLTSGLLTELLFYYVLRNADLVIAQHADQLKALNSIRKNRASVVIPNIYLKRETKEFQNGDFNFIYIGSLDKRKGLCELKNLVEMTKEKKFKIIGLFRGKGKACYESLLTAENIIYSKKVDHEDVVGLINSSEALISTSQSEGFPNVFLEAWSVNKPVISLSVNPGNVINKYDLGKCFNGDLEKMAVYLSNFKSKKYDYSAYMENNHSEEKNIDLFRRAVESLL